mmetsp:Transcript_17751/g.49235  ORF Transcript_17751/g.49235 Transcript_17751/m.49235 type:complete len:229 (-) Transcript_17751:124-810(-)
MLLCDSHPGDSLQLESLAWPHLDDGNPRVLRLLLLVLAEEVRRRDGLVGRYQILRRDSVRCQNIVFRSHGVDFVKAHIKFEFHRTSRAAIVTNAFHVRQEGAVAISSLDRVRRLIPNGYQTQSMRDVLIVEDCRILRKLHQVDGQSRHFGDHYPSQCIGHARVRLAQHELHFVRRHVQDLHLWEALMRHGGVVSMLSLIVLEVLLGLAIAVLSQVFVPVSQGAKAIHQ